MILKIFSPKKISKNWLFSLITKLNYVKVLIITLVFEKNANFFGENWQKSQKIVIITSTPVHGHSWDYPLCWFYLNLHSSKARLAGHAAPGIKQKAISVWFIPTNYVDCESERFQQKRFGLLHISLVLKTYPCLSTYFYQHKYIHTRILVIWHTY
jgi:hypothetical protein